LRGFSIQKFLFFEKFQPSQTINQTYFIYFTFQN
jgi:hypothetical protein